MNRHMIRWADLQNGQQAPAYDWRFVLEEAAKLVIIGLMAWLAIQLLFPWPELA